MNNPTLFDRVYGCMLGGLIGDAMGAPVENWHYRDIAAKHGVLSTFSGDGTDDSAVKFIIYQSLIENDGYITADELAASFLHNPQFYNLFYIPVRNMYHKIKDHLALPIDAGNGNMQSSSSAMAISPIGIINACHPRQAAIEAFDAASLVHSGLTGFCRDGACAIAAAIAQSMVPQTKVDEVVDAASRYLHQTSSRIMIDQIHTVMDLARRSAGYEHFREQFYEQNLCDVICDSRETIPATLAIFYLSDGDPERCIVNAANFGRDADTIASMVGAIAGAYRGVEGLNQSWVEQIEQGASKQKEMAVNLVGIIEKRKRQLKSIVDHLSSM